MLKIEAKPARGPPFICVSGAPTTMNSVCIETDCPNLLRVPVVGDPYIAVSNQCCAFVGEIVGFVVGETVGDADVLSRYKYTAPTNNYSQRSDQKIEKILS